MTEPKGQEEIRKIVNPLLSVDPRSLDALMAEDVELLKDEDADRIVAELQRQRAQWMQNEAIAAAKPKRGARGSSEKISVNLDDIGL